MKVSKAYIGRRVTVVWEDPHESERQDYKDALKGRAALARWEEEGIIDDITEGVVRLRHSAAYVPGKLEIDEALFTWVKEDLILDIKSYREEVGSGSNPVQP